LTKRTSFLGKNFPILEIFVDFLLLNAAFFLAVLFKRGKVVLEPEYQSLLLVYYGLWAVASLVTKRYKIHRPEKFIVGLQPYVRSFICLTFLLFFVIFTFKLFSYSRFIILSFLIIYSLLTVAAYSLLYLYFWRPEVNVEDEDAGQLDSSLLKDIQEIRGIDQENRGIGESLKFCLKESLPEGNSELFSFLDETILLERIKVSQSILLDANHSVSVRSLLGHKWEFVGNLGKINQFQRINKFFIAVNSKLVPGGYFLGVAETFLERLERKFKKWPRPIRKPLYLLDFIWNRAFPKITGLKKIYFFFRRKGARVISLHEILGRLIFCGFGDIRLREINHLQYFIARKIRLPLEEKNPSYGLIFKQKRIGQFGEPVYIYKMRTMYPYSEYIHTLSLHRNPLDSIGKIRDDPRITSWGRFLRRHWIDELPMLINLLQGDLKLVGVRPISRSFLNIYPEELRAERIKLKPGLMPASYGDKPKSIDEFFKAEQTYIKKYKKHPRKTDFVYFFKILNSIIFHKVRST